MRIFHALCRKPQPQPSHTPDWMTLDALDCGLFKRIDENRELLSLWLRDEPAWLSAHPSITSILNNHDQFLCAIHNHCPGLAHTLRGHRGPRPWPVPLPHTRTEYLARHATCVGLEILSSHPLEAQTHDRFLNILIQRHNPTTRLIEHQTLATLFQDHPTFLNDHWWIPSIMDCHQRFFTLCRDLVSAHTDIPADLGSWLP